MRPGIRVSCALLLATLSSLAAETYPSGSFISIPLWKKIDGSVQRILQEAVKSGAVNELNLKFPDSVNETQTLADNFKDDKYVQFFGRIEIGSHKQKFHVAFNPAAPLTTIPSYKLKSKCGDTFNGFDAASSNSFHPILEKLIMDDGQQNVTANISKDVFHLGKDVKVIEQYFGLVEDEICDRDRKYDGVIGLGFSTKYITLMDNLIEQRKVNNSIVGLYMDRRHRDNKCTPGGEVTIGNLNPKYVKNETYHFIPIVEGKRAWQILITYAFIGPTQITFERYAVIDSRSYFIDLPWHEAAFVQREIGAVNFKGNLIVKCNNVSKLPELRIFIHYHPYILTPKDYVDTENQYKGYCSVLIRSTLDDVWTLGGAFLGKFYTILDYEKEKVAFAELVPASRASGYSNIFITPIFLFIGVIISYWK